ncbi:hypothetical protein QBC36DRAFT_292973 [Triangularia setosa]|uniref:Uncharacterized protein n=1 Tax=Triangularia setosa TaxID=2587417 RepID=A0AAN6W2M8_9PEZI|nr:hypothetical protein QBC36DRAFT_292973 [Podospora setosa]
MKTTASLPAALLAFLLFQLHSTVVAAATPEDNAITLGWLDELISKKLTAERPDPTQIRTLPEQKKKFPVDDGSTIWFLTREAPMATRVPAPVASVAAFVQPVPREYTINEATTVTWIRSLGPQVTNVGLILIIIVGVLIGVGLASIAVFGFPRRLFCRSGRKRAVTEISDVERIKIKLSEDRGCRKRMVRTSFRRAKNSR